jgi:hypothetical protein
MVQAVYIQPNKKRRLYQAIDDSDEEDTGEKGSLGGDLAAGKEDGQCADDEALAKKLQDSEYRAGQRRSRQVQILSDSDEDEDEEVNPITITLQRCDQIAASLREELHAGSSSENAVNEDRYAEVDVAAAKIVSQVCYITVAYVPSERATKIMKAGDVSLLRVFLRLALL